MLFLGFSDWSVLFLALSERSMPFLAFDFLSMLLLRFSLWSLLFRDFSTWSMLGLDLSTSSVLLRGNSRQSELVRGASGRSKFSADPFFAAGVFSIDKKNFFKWLMYSWYSSKLQWFPPLIQRGSYFSLHSSQSCFPWEQSTTSSAVPCSKGKRGLNWWFIGWKHAKDLFWWSNIYFLIIIAKFELKTR